MQEANKPKEAAKIWPEDLARVYHNEVYKQDPDVWMIWGNGSVTLMMITHAHSSIVIPMAYFVEIQLQEKFAKWIMDFIVGAIFTVPVLKN